jgi:hypothetical protein
VKVEEQTYRTMREPEIREQLDRVNSLESFYSFDFEDDFSFDDQVEAVTAIDALGLVDNWKRLSSLDAEASRSNFNREARLVCIF